MCFLVSIKIRIDSMRGMILFLVVSLITLTGNQNIMSFVDASPNSFIEETISNDVAVELSSLDCAAYGNDAAAAAASDPFTTAAAVTNPTEAPSDAPSAAPPCYDPLSNARGTYSSTYAPCTIKFHSISNSQRDEQEEGEESYSAIVEEIEYIDYHTSNLCHNDNVLVAIQEYLPIWPDECVGDFQRCYSIEHHQYIYPFICMSSDAEEEPNQSKEDSLNLFGAGNNTNKKNHHQYGIAYHPRWELPPGTTHISVDCTHDKELAQHLVIKQESEHRHQMRAARREQMGMKLFNWVLVFVSTMAIIYVISHLIVKPLVSMVASRRQRRRNNRRQRRNNSRRSSSSCHESRRTYRTSSTLSSSTSSLPMHYNSDHEQVTLIPDNCVTAMGEVTTATAIAEGHAEHEDNSESTTIDHDDDDDSRSSTTDDSYSYNDNGNNEEDERHMHDFDSQVPCDFDAVPIVSATVLSDTDPIPATVIQDGISYS